MIRYKIDVYSMLADFGINTTIAKQTGIFSQAVMQKFKNGDTAITMDIADRLCDILCLQLSDIFEYVPTVESLERRKDMSKDTFFLGLESVDYEDWTYEHVAQSIGGTVYRAFYITYDAGNRAKLESRPLETLICSIADGYCLDKKYGDLYALMKFPYSLKKLHENDCETALKYYSHALGWLLSHKDDPIDRGFYCNYMKGWTCDIFKYA